MRKFLSLLTMLILCQYSLSSHAEDNLLYLSGDKCSPGQDGELTISLKNVEQVSSYACAVYLPEGFTLKEIKPITSRGGQGYFQLVETNDGGMLLTSMNESATAFTGSDGPVAKVSVSVPEDIAPGEYDVQLKRISLSNSGGTSLSVNGSFTYKWTIQTTPYTITFDSNGGSPVESITLGYGSTITPPANPTREGYTFSGWEPEIPSVMPKEDMTVTAKWTVNSYALTYMVGGDVYKTSSVNYGAAITPETAPTKEGYTFSGWSEIPATMPAHDVTVTGSFSINSYTLIYMVDDKVYKTSSVNYGAAITPEAALTKEGHTFSGWSEIPATMPAHDVTVTGSFSVNSYTLTYMVDDKVYKTSSVNYGAAITPEAALTKEGYTFSGWSEIPATMPANDVTVTGSFSINSYTLTYMVDGEVFKTLTFTYGAAITPEAEPTKPSYAFSGWSEIPATMPAHDVNVTGTFTYISDTRVSDLDNIVYIDNVEGFVGQQLTLSVKMKNTVGIQTVQFDLCLPEGVTVAKDDDGFDLIELSTVRTTAKKMDSFSSSQVSGNTYRVLINSNRGYTFDGEDGEIVLVKVNIAPNIQEGDYPIYLRNIVLVNTSSEGYETEYVKLTLSVSNYIPGDVNGDSKVNAIDLNAIVNYILEHRNFPFTFVEKAADLNADDKINAIDVNTLTNMILRGDAPQNAKKQMPVMVGILEEQ